MQYLVSKDNFTKITEPKGTIQNISKTLTIEVSETQTKNSGVLLPPMGKIQFDGSSVYARCVDGAGAEARVIPFEVVAKGGGGDGGVTADFSLDQAGTTIVENFKFSALEYPNATNPNLDGKTVLVMSVKDANATTSLVKYVFVDLAKLVGSSTNLKPSDNAIGISGASIGLNLSASAGNILSVADDGLYADLSVADGVSGNFAVIGESGAIVDGGFSFADLAGLSAGKVFAGATSTAAGLSGLVPAPQTGDEFKFLRGDGTWSGELVLPTVSSSVNGGFWLDVSGTPPAPKFHYGGKTYMFDVTVERVIRYNITQITMIGDSNYGLYTYHDGDEPITEFTITAAQLNHPYAFSKFTGVSITIKFSPYNGAATPTMEDVTGSGDIIKNFSHQLLPSGLNISSADNYTYTESSEIGGTTTITIREAGYEVVPITINWQVAASDITSL